MNKSFREITDSVSSSLSNLRRTQPELDKGFSALAKGAMRSGTVDLRTKEFIALALGVGSHCDACIGFHMKALIRLGARREEIEEVLGVAVYMGGGPSLMYAADALKAYEELSEPAQNS